MTTRHSNPPSSDREALSALFDGELAGDAARFALKRLDHDQDWRGTCDRWRVIGESLRGQGALLPASFPMRVRDAVRAEGTAAMRSTALPATGTDGRTWRGPRWGSVALAASAAMVAFFLARHPGSPDAPTQPQLAATQSAPATPAPQPQTPDAQIPDAPSMEAATAAVAVAAVARPTQRQRNVQRDRAATDRMVSAAVAAQRAPVTGEAPTAVLVSQQQAPVLDATAVETNASTPTGAFAEMATGTQDPGASRPWPRAVLPQYSGNGTLAADYASAPSFYPFSPREPRPAENANAPAVQEQAVHEQTVDEQTVDTSNAPPP